jgi:hypothetical protein
MIQNLVLKFSEILSGLLWKKSTLGERPKYFE